MKALVKYALGLAIGTMMATGPAMADKPAWAGSDKGGNHERADTLIIVPASPSSLTK